jgi:3-oxoadipate enol-lactonase
MAIAHYARLGEGESAVLMLHGIGGSHEVFANQMSALAQHGYSALAWDMPGYGRTEAVMPYDFAALAQACLQLMDQVVARRWILVGHSMGGMVAQEVVARAPERVDGLVLVATSAAFGHGDGPWQQRFIAERTAALDAGGTLAQLAHQLVPSMVAPTTQPGAVQEAERIMSRVPDASYRAALAALVNFDRRASLGAIGVPTLLVAGAQDQTAPAKVMQGMAQRIRGARLVVLEQCGHLVNMEQPLAFTATLLEFLKQHFPTP